MMPTAVAGTHTRSYRALLALPGARAPVIASALGSMPIGMFGLAILLLARDATGSFAEAGRVAGAFGLANALGAVAQGRLMDRLGQPRVLRAAAAGHVVALAAVVLAAEEGAPSWALALLAAAGGACLPQLPAAMRSLWTTLVADPARAPDGVRAASPSSFEVAVVTAPALVAAIVAVASPGAAVARRRGARRRRRARVRVDAALARRWRGTRARDRLARPARRARHAHAGARGSRRWAPRSGSCRSRCRRSPTIAAARASAGLLLAALSAGSLIGGLVYGARRWPGTPAARLPALLLALGGGLRAAGAGGRAGRARRAAAHDGHASSRR